MVELLKGQNEANEQMRDMCKMKKSEVSDLRIAVLRASRTALCALGSDASVQVAQ